MIALRRRNERSFNEARQNQRNIQLRDFLVAANRDRSFEAPASSKDAKPFENALLEFREPLVTPIQRSTHRLLPFWGRAAALRKQVEAAIQGLLELGQGQRVYACGGQLDRKRQSFEPSADRREGAASLAIQLRRTHRFTSICGAKEKKTRRRHRAQLDQRGDPPFVDDDGCKRFHVFESLAGDAYRLAARGEDPNVSTVTEEAVGDGRNAVEQMLAIVEDDQERLKTERGDQCVDHWLTGALANVEDGADAWGHRLPVFGRCQFDEPSAPRHRIDQLLSNLEREPGFAD